MVYVVQEQTGKDLSKAKEYGELISLLPQKLIVGLSVVQVKQRLDTSLASFSNNDYLLLIGDPVAIGMAMTIAAKYSNGIVRTLKWDRQLQSYYEVRVDFN
jgi:hypothetical protein